MLFVMFTLFGVSIAVVHAMGRGVCTARVLWGKECLFCGCTSDFFGMFRGDFSFHNPISPWAFGLIAVEMAWRIAAAIRGGSRRVIIADVVVHLVLGAVVLMAHYYVLM